MNPLLILAIGMAVVVGGILVLRLHAFLSLTAGAIVVAALTPAASLGRFAVRSAALPVVHVDDGGASALIKADAKKAPVGSTLELLRLDGATQAFKPAGKLVVKAVEKDPAGKPRGMRAEAVAPATIDPATDLILTPQSAEAAPRSVKPSLGERVADGFGSTAAGVGLLVAMAAVLGRALMESGAAERIVWACRQALGDRRAPLAFLISGFVLGNLVFAETVFYLLIPIAKVMRVRSGRDYTLYVLCIVAGATMTHSLVPPTPGPASAAQEFGVSFAVMIPAGMAVGAIAAAAGYLYARVANRRWDVPLRAEVGLSDREFESIAARDISVLPPLWVSLIPIILPVALIAAAAYNKAAAATWPGSALLETLGDKNIALAIAAGIGLLLVSRQKAVGGRQEKATPKGGASLPTAHRLPPTLHFVGDALAGAGVIILIICAGGAFGQALRQTDIAATLGDLLPHSRHALLPLAFLAAAILRTAQGSATVAMITAAGIIAPIATAAPLPYHPVYLALAVGCGSKPFMWMNDSGFWVISRMSGFNEGETLKTASTMMAIEATVGLGVVMLGAWLVPLA